MSELKQRSIVRIALNLLLMGSIAWFFWWVSLACAVVLVARYRAYEVIFWGAVLDFLYGTSAVLAMPFLSTLVFTVCLLVAELIKPYLVFYDR